MIDELDKKIISFIQGDLPVCRRPFAELARKIGVSEKRVIERIRVLQKRDVIRRFGATLRHQKAGYRSNAMVAWVVPEDRIDETGALFAGFREVTHCYQRKPQDSWHYNLYTMIHGDSRKKCRQIADRMSKAAGMDEFLLLFSEKEFRKTSMAYF